MPKVNRLPESWYWIGHGTKFKKKPELVRLLDRKFVVYRKTDGGLVATTANCPHAGANLSKGRIENDQIVCPFHAWKFGEDGVCKKIPGTNGIPKFARLAIFPIRERHGMVFLYTGRVPKYDLPFFEGKHPDDFFSSNKVIHIYQDTVWWSVVANSFDVQHFIHMHKRVPREEPIFDYSTPYAAKVRYKFRNEGTWLGDRLLRKIGGPNTELEITTYCGNFMVSTTTFGEVKNYMISVNEQLDDVNSVTHIIFYSEGAKRSWLWRTARKLRLRLQGFISKRFFQGEADEIQNVQYRLRTLHEQDRPLRDFLLWLEKATHETGRGKAKPCDQPVARTSDQEAVSV